MEIDEQKEEVENIAAVKVFVSKEKADQFIPVESKKSNKQTYERVVKRNTTHTNPYNSSNYIVVVIWLVGLPA